MPLPDRHPLEGPTGGEHETSLLFYLEGLHPHHIDLGMVTPVIVVEINIYHGELFKQLSTQDLLMGSPLLLTVFFLSID